MKLATVGNGAAVHLQVQDTFKEFTRSDGRVFPAHTVENTACGAVESGGNALYGHRRRALNVFEGELPEVTCQRCKKSAAHKEAAAAEAPAAEPAAPEAPEAAPAEHSVKIYATPAEFIKAEITGPMGKFAKCYDIDAIAAKYMQEYPGQTFGVAQEYAENNTFWLPMLATQNLLPESEWSAADAADAAAVAGVQPSETDKRIGSVLGTLTNNTVVQDKHGDVGIIMNGKIWYPETASLTLEYAARYAPFKILAQP